MRDRCSGWFWFRIGWQSANWHSLTHQRPDSAYSGVISLSVKPERTRWKFIGLDKPHKMTEVQSRSLDDHLPYTTVFPQMNQELQKRKMQKLSERVISRPKFFLGRIRQVSLALGLAAAAETGIRGGAVRRIGAAGCDAIAVAVGLVAQEGSSLGHLRGSGGRSGGICQHGGQHSAQPEELDRQWALPVPTDRR